MTNVNQVNDSGQSYAASNTPGQKSEKTDGFKNALIDALDKSESSKMENTPTNALGEIASKGPQFIDNASAVTGKTDNLLNMLDLYSAQLENPDVSLKSIAPVLEKIKDNAGELLKESESLSESDTALKRIAQETALMAQTEYLKFQRGDYLS